MTNSDVDLCISQVVKRYRRCDEDALKGINLTIKQGEFFGLLGPNGCGKTTLISILTGLLSASSGQVNYQCDGQEYNVKKVRHLIGLVPQEIALFPTLNIRENLSFFGRLYYLSGSKLKERMDTCIEIAQLEKFVKRPVGDYSGGMRRRANLVTALLQEPKILFLDEPAVNVDAHSRAVIFNILDQLNHQGTTMIYTTHYMQEASEQCSRIAIMDDGKVLRVGAPQALISETPGANDLNDVFMQLTGKELRD